MKKKLLVLAPLFALVLSGCMVRTPSRKRRSSSEQPSTSESSSGTSTPSSGTSGGSSGTSGSDSGSSGTSTPTPSETRGTLDQPLTVAQAREFGMAIEDNPQGTEYDTLDSYISGIVTTAPQESTKTAGTWQFKIADAYTSNQTITFYWGSVDSGVTVPVQGDQVTVFGRLARYKSNTIELAGYEQGEIADPVLKASAHRTVSISVNNVEHATVSNIPTSAQTGDTVSFTVSPAQNYSVESVKVNGSVIQEAQGSYSFKVVDDASIVINVVEGQVVKSSLQLAYEGAQSGSTEAFTFTGTVVAITGNSFYVQDGEYGMYVYNKATSGNAVGKAVSITSTVKTFHGLVETNSITSSEVTGDGQLPAAASVTSSATLAALNQNVLVNVSEAIFVSKDQDWSGSANSMAIFSIGGDNVTIKFDKYGFNADKAAVLNALAANDKVVLSNVVTSYYDAPQIGFAGTSAIEKIVPVVTPTSVNITSGSELLVGGTLNLTAEVGPAGAPQDVEWSITSGGDCATLAGNVLTGTNPGSVVVKATAVGHADVNASATITVTAPQKQLIENLVADPTSVSIRVGDNPVQLGFTATPSNYEENVVWSSSAEGVATVSDAGLLTPVAPGTATIRVEGDESHVGADIAVTVRAQLTSLQDVCAAAEAAGSTGSTDAYTFAGVVTGITGNSFYLQDDAGYGMYVYNKATDGIAVGKIVEVTAKVCTYNGLIETKSGTATASEVIGDGTLPTPAAVTNAASLAALHQAVLANVASATFVSKDQDWSSSKASLVTLSIGGDNIVIKFDKYGYDANKATVLNALVANDNVVLSNVLTSYNNTPQLAFAGTSSIQKVTAVPTEVNITSATTVLEKRTLELTAEVGPSGASQNVVWTIESGAEHATLSGNVLTGVSAGEVIVKATAEGYPDVYDDTTITVQPLVLTSLSFKQSAYSFLGGSTQDMGAEVTFSPEDATKNLAYSIKETGKSSTISATTGSLTVSNSDSAFTVVVSDSVSGLEAECPVTVTSTKTLSSIELSGTHQLTFAVDETFSYEGLVVTAHYSDLSTAVVTPTSVSSPDMTTAGEKTVTVSYTEGGVTVTADYMITVYALTPTEDHTLTWTASAASDLGAKIDAVNGTDTGTISTSGFSWNYTRTLVGLASGKSDYIALQGSTWIQLGSNNAMESISFTTSAISGTIKSITVVAATAGSHTLTIDVGGTKYLDGAALTTYSGTASATNPDPANCAVSGTGTSTGTITITIAPTAATKKAMVIRSITVVANY